MGPVLYSLGDVAAGAGGTQTPVVATLRQLAEDPGPHPSGPTQACGGGSRNPRRRLPWPSQGLSGPFPLSVDPARPGPEGWGPGYASLPAFPLFTWLLSVHLFLMSFCQMYVCLSGLFILKLIYVIQTSCESSCSPTPNPKLAGRAHIRGALAEASIPNWQEPVFNMLKFSRKKKYL